MLENWPNQEGWSTDPFINYLIFMALIFIPVLKIAKRLGLPFWVAFPIFIPYIGFFISTALIANMEWNYAGEKREEKQ